MIFRLMKSSSIHSEQFNFSFSFSSDWVTRKTPFLLLKRGNRKWWTELDLLFGCWCSRNESKVHCCCGAESFAVDHLIGCCWNFFFSFRKLESQWTAAAAAAAGESVRTSAAETPRSRKRYTFLSWNHVCNGHNRPVFGFKKDSNRSPILTGMSKWHSSTF